MKNFLAFILLVAVLFPVGASALTFRFGENYSLGKSESIEGDLYVAGGNTAVSGNVLGDLLVAGANVFVGNTVSEDVAAIGGTVNIIGRIEGDLRAAGGNIVFSRFVGDDGVFAGGEIKVLPNSEIVGDAAFAGGKVVIDGTIAGDLNIAGGEVSINNVTRGNVSIAADTLVISPSAVIVGDLTYASGRPAFINEGAQISGEIIFNEINTRSSAERFLPTLWSTWIFIKLVMLFVAGFLLNVILKNISLKFVATTLSHFWKSLLRGFLITISVPVMALLLFFTFVGWPFIALGFSSWIFLSVLAWVYGAIVIGTLARRLVKRDKETVVTWKTIALGVFTVFILSYIPYFGLAIRLVFFTAALGGIWQVIYDKFLNAR